MKFAVLLLTFLFTIFISVECFFIPEVRKIPIPNGADVGKPLFLTPLIKAGKIKKAQHLSQVKPMIGNQTSYTGYFTTNKKCGNNLFFWFFPAQENWENAPLVLWLQGGPGASSMYGLFEELGPFNSFPDGLQNRYYSWNVKNNLLFIDQPVGTGYSFTKKGCYANNLNTSSKDLYSALIQFLKLFPNLQKNKFFITGESFGGHYIPALGRTIHHKNYNANLKIPLSGMMIGDGWMGPKEQIIYGDFLYQVGLIGYSQREEFYNLQNIFVKEIDEYDWNAAFSTWSDILNLFEKYAGVNIYNFLPQKPDESNWDIFLQLPSTRKAIHVGPTKFSEQSYEVYHHLLKTTMQTVKPWVEELLEYYPIVFFVGEVDVICAYPGVVNFLRSLKWSGQELYLNANRTKWFERDEIVGYIKGQKNMFDVLVRDAGHMVAADQPFWAYQLVNAFTTGHGTGHFGPTS